MNEHPPDERARVDWFAIIFSALGVAVTAALTFFGPERLIPRPLGFVQLLFPFVVGAAIISSIIWTERLKAAAGTIIVVLGVAVSVLGVLQIRYVKLVEEAHYLVGFRRVQWALSQYGGSSDEEIIYYEGGTYGDLKEIWGWSFEGMAIGYVFAYSIAVVTFVLALSTLRVR